MADDQVKYSELQSVGSQDTIATPPRPDLQNIPSVPSGITPNDIESAFDAPEPDEAVS